MTLGCYNNYSLLNTGMYGFNSLGNNCCLSPNYYSGQMIGALLCGGLTIGTGIALTVTKSKKAAKAKAQEEAQKAFNDAVKAQEDVIKKATEDRDTKKTAYNEAVTAWEKDNKEIQDGIVTEKDNVKKYNAAVKENEGYQADINLKNNKIGELGTEINNLRSKQSQLNQDKTADHSAEIESINKQIAKIEEQKTALKQEADKLQEKINKNNQNIINVDKYKNAQANLDALEERKKLSLETTQAVKSAKEDWDKSEETLKTEQQKLKDLKSQKNMSSNIDSVDGCGLGRLVDGKNTVKDQLAAFRKASDKLTQHEQLSEKDIQALANAAKIADAIDEGSSQTDNMKTVASQLRAFASTHKDEIEMYSRILNGNATADDIQKSGYFEKQERYVGDTKMTTYNGKGDNDSYIIQDGKATKLTESRSGNMFHKVKYNEVK